MKKIIVLCAAALFAASLLSCEKKSDSDTGFTLDKDTSYAIGISMAEQMFYSVPIQLHFDYKAFMEGFRDYMEQEETRLSQDQVYEKLQDMFTQISTQLEEMNRADGAQYIAEGEQFLAENARKPGVITTSSGLQYEILVQGDGPKPTAYDIVQVHYEGTLLDGTVFDSSYLRGEPAILPLDGVIAGWTEGIQLMNVGSTYMFYIPQDLAYGSRGAGNGAIPPFATLIFKVELLEVAE